jgi:hypothetical protein
VRKIYRNGSHCWSSSLLCHSLSLWLLGGVTASLVTGRVSVAGHVLWHLSLCHLVARWGLCLPLWIVWQGMQGRGFCLAKDVRVRMNANGVRMNVNGVEFKCEWDGVEFEFEWDGVEFECKWGRERGLDEFKWG